MKIVIACMLGIWVTIPVVFAQKPRLDPAHVMGAQACSECHGKEVDAWRATKHFKTFKDLEKRPLADTIAENLDIDDLKSESLCIECHFTVQKKGAKHVAISGVSCESCHGAAKDWIKEHNKEKVPRATRKGVAEKAGMLYPQNIYAVASNCYDCHVIDNEELVNKGGHPAFSKEFDLYAWSQGEVRHSFMTDGTPVKKAGEVNRAADANHKRVLYMVGKLLNLEYELRALSKGTTTKKPPAAEVAYAIQHVVRVDKLIKQIDVLNKAATTPEVTKIIAHAKAVSLKRLNDTTRKNAAAAADKISVDAAAFAKAHDGSKLGGLDSKIPATHGTIFKP